MCFVKLPNTLKNGDGYYEGLPSFEKKEVVIKFLKHPKVLFTKFMKITQNCGIIQEPRLRTGQHMLLKKEVFPTKNVFGYTFPALCLGGIITHNITKYIHIHKYEIPEFVFQINVVYSSV